MAIKLILVGSTPSTPQFGLDQLTLHYKAPDNPWSDVIVDTVVPEKGDPHPTFSKMFVTDRNLQESGQSSCAFDVVYMGAFKADGNGNPILPPAKRESDSQVMSASSKKSNLGFTVLEPVTIQFYAPSSQKTWFTTAPPITGFADNPTGSPNYITLTSGDTSYAPGTTIDSIVNAFFTRLITHSLRSTEIVAGRYWQNISRKILSLSPWAFDITSGAYITLYSPGDGYHIGDTLTISAGGQSAIIVVDSVGGIQGTGILNWHTTFNNFTTAHDAIFASGGFGSGAGFNVTIIP
jgi:hypothetical protein